MLYIIILGFVAYVMSGLAFVPFVNRYLHELECKLFAKGLNWYKIYIPLKGPFWMRRIMNVMYYVAWPINVIIVLLHAEWNYSKLTQP